MLSEGVVELVDFQAAAEYSSATMRSAVLGVGEGHAHGFVAEHRGDLLSRPVTQFNPGDRWRERRSDLPAGVSDVLACESETSWPETCPSGFTPKTTTPPRPLSIAESVRAAWVRCPVMALNSTVSDSRATAAAWISETVSVLGSRCAGRSHGLPTMRPRLPVADIVSAKEANSWRRDSAVVCCPDSGAKSDALESPG